MLSKYKQHDMCISCRIWKQDIVHSAHSSKLMDDIDRPEGEKSDNSLILFSLSFPYYLCLYIQYFISSVVFRFSNPEEQFSENRKQSKDFCFFPL